MAVQKIGASTLDDKVSNKAAREQSDRTGASTAEIYMNKAAREQSDRTGASTAEIDMNKAAREQADMNKAAREQADMNKAAREEADMNKAAREEADMNEAAREQADINESVTITETREYWSRALDFLMTCIGFSVGLGNVWRFPYLCYKNGGGAFLIPYFLSVVFGGIPLFYLEVAVGQYMSLSGLQAWNIVPLFQGIGLTSCIIVFLLGCYYNVILCWAFYYFFASFTTELPWQYCGNEWNTENCSEDFTKTIQNQTSWSSSTLMDPATEFWENKVLDISDGLNEIGYVKVDLALCLLLAWVLVFCCISGGIKSTGQVVYVTATSPYILMVILLVRNSMLDGAMEGVKYYLTPDISRLSEFTVWVDAGTQIMFSYSIGLGTLTALGSYNKFTHNSYRDSIIFSFVNTGTSLLAGFIVFMCLGFMAKQQKRSISEVAESGPGLAFIAYPKAVSQMPLASLWSVCFFLMLILIGLDSQFVGVEGVIATFVDQFPRILRKRYRKLAFTVVCCIVMYLVGLGGMYIFQLFDYYSGSRIILLVALCELVAIAHVYGIRRFSDNVRMMIGDSWLSYSIPYLQVCWTVISPLFCIAVFVLSVIDYTHISYIRPNGRVYNYPLWGILFGWTLAASSVIYIPLLAVFKLIKYGVSYEVFKLLLVPYRLRNHQKRPEDFGERSLWDYRREKKNQRQAINV